jgi:long-subunit acyl-CoA synthetase (AMP-forming)
MHTYNIVKALVKEAFEINNPLSMDLNGENRFFSFLPLNHIGERAVVELMCLRYGGVISFTESLPRFAANLKSVKATMFFAVPRIYTKFRMAILEKMPQKKLDLLLKIPFVKSIIKKKIQTGLGLDQCRVAAVGAAPIAQETKDWYSKLGIPITEGYGMTENCAATSFLYPHEDKPHSVGLPHPGCEVKINPETNEILVKSNYIMKGYYNDEQKSKETIVEGWLHTGDQGKLDDEGYIYITGRVKDTFKTAKAKFIVPSQIEAKFEESTEIEQMCLLGLGMPQPIMMVQLSEAAAKIDKEKIEQSLTTLLDKTNAKLANYKKVSNIVVMNGPFCIEKNTLTPTLKVKRPQVHDEFKERLLGWCESGQKVIWE